MPDVDSFIVGFTYADAVLYSAHIWWWILYSALIYTIVPLTFGFPLFFYHACSPTFRFNLNCLVVFMPIFLFHQKSNVFVCVYCRIAKSIYINVSNIRNSAIGHRCHFKSNYPYMKIHIYSVYMYTVHSIHIQIYQMIADAMNSQT